MLCFLLRYSVEKMGGHYASGAGWCQDVSVVSERCNGAIRPWRGGCWRVVDSRGIGLKYIDFFCSELRGNEKKMEGVKKAPFLGKKYEKRGVPGVAILAHFLLYFLATV